MGYRRYSHGLHVPHQHPGLPYSGQRCRQSLEGLPAAARRRQEPGLQSRIHRPQPVGSGILEITDR